MGEEGCVMVKIFIGMVGEVINVMVILLFGLLCFDCVVIDVVCVIKCSFYK